MISRAFWPVHAASEMKEMRIMRQCRLHHALEKLPWRRTGLVGRFCCQDRSNVTPQVDRHRCLHVRFFGDHKHRAQVWSRWNSRMVWFWDQTFAIQWKYTYCQISQVVGDQVSVNICLHVREEASKSAAEGTKNEDLIYEEHMRNSWSQYHTHPQSRIANR